MNPHDFGLLDPHPESAFGCGCGSGISYIQIPPMIKKLKFLNISLVYFKG
jgi:hypothetical protein